MKVFPLVRQGLRACACSCLLTTFSPIAHAHGQDPHYQSGKHDDPRVVAADVVTENVNNAVSNDVGQSDLRVDPLDVVFGNITGPHPEEVTAFVDRSSPKSLHLMRGLLTLLARHPDIVLVFKDLPDNSDPNSMETARLDVATRLMLRNNADNGSGIREYELLAIDAQRMSKPDALDAETAVMQLRDGAKNDESTPAVAQYLAANANLAVSMGIQSAPVTLIGREILTGDVSPHQMEQFLTATPKEHGR